MSLPQTIREGKFTGRPADFDDEFKYDDGRYGGQYRPDQDIEANVSKMLDKIEAESDIATKTGSQTIEEFQRLFEKNVNSRRGYRWPNQEELRIKREGRIIHMNEFMRLLRSAGVNAWYSNKGGMPRTVGLYVGHEGLLPRCSHLPGAPHYVGFVQVPMMQEYEELHFDRYNVPLGSKRRGWRTVLLRLVEQGILSEHKAHEVFREPSTGPISRRYREYLQFLRGRPQ